MRPDLFGAIVCQVPLLDMCRYHKLLAGASWMAEYGNPDTSDWADFLHKYSPYQNLKAETEYPPVLFTTSTRDDRVHPGHARKMVSPQAAPWLAVDRRCGEREALRQVKRLTEECPAAKEVLYYENVEGGHGGAADNKQRAYMSTLAYTFLQRSLG